MSDTSVLLMPAVIIDNGSGSCKAGLTCELKPRLAIPSVVGHEKDHMEACYFGEDALSMKQSLVVNYPIQRGIITHWDDMENLWTYIYEYKLKVKPSERPLLLSEPPLNPHRNREMMTQLMFEHFQVPAFYLSIQATLAVYASARTTGLVMDIGDGVTHVVPIYDGYCLPHGVSRLAVAGRDISEYLRKFLSGHRPLRKYTKEEMVKYIKEKLCYVSLEPQQGAAKKGGEVLKLPDEKTIQTELHRAPEILFDPKIIGVEAPGLHTMMTNSINMCDKDIHNQLYGNLVLAGGSSLFKGLDGRIFNEIESQVPDRVPVRIIAPPERSCASWLGGSIITSLVSFLPMWITKEDYKEFGADAVHRKCF